MRRSARLAEKEANVEDVAQTESKAKKRQLDVKITIINIDNDTMADVFKYLNYCQLAINSLVSKKYRDLIQNNRHKLARLYVDNISMESFRNAVAAVKIFDKDLSPAAYNEWVFRNSYSKQVPLESQVVSAQRTQNAPSRYLLRAYAHYKDPNSRKLQDRTTVFFARVEFTNENWPVFQHFLRLAKDAFIYIVNVHFIYQNDVLNLLAGAFNSDHRLQCKELVFHLRGNGQEAITWTKNHARCNKFCTVGNASLNQDEALLDFLLTGALCTSEINFINHCYREFALSVDSDLTMKQIKSKEIAKAVKEAFEYAATLNPELMSPGGKIKLIGFDRLKEFLQDKEDPKNKIAPTSYPQWLKRIQKPKNKDDKLKGLLNAIREKEKKLLDMV